MAKAPPFQKKSGGGGATAGKCKDCGKKGPVNAKGLCATCARGK